MKKRMISLILSVFLVFSVSGSIIATGEENEAEVETFSVMEKNLITGEETVRSFDEGDFENLPLNNVALDPVQNLGEEMISTYGIIGSDDRDEVDDTTNLPYSAISYIRIDWPGITTTKHGTAWMISKNIAVTAAHNLYNPKTDTWAKGVRIYPGKDGTGLWNDPFKSTFAIGFGVSSNWDAGDFGNNNYDWGLIILDSPLGEETGFINFRSPHSNAEILNAPIKISGYSDGGGLFNDYLQREASGTIVAFTSHLLEYNVDTEGGASGAPVLLSDNVAIGIHSRDNSSNGTNYGIRITPEICNYFNTAISENS